MELGLMLQLVVPPCLSRRAVALPSDFISPCVLRRRRIRATRLKKHGVGAMCNAVMTYSGVEQEMVEEQVEEEEVGPAVSTRPRLELIEKPDRSLALLDEYESEELGTSLCANHRSGYVAVLGKPNVGKSTIINQMVGQKLSIVTDKLQTTRHRILGICSEPEYQIILYDTPGVIKKEMHKLDSMMMKNVRSAIGSADCVLVVADACKAPEKIDEMLEEGVGNKEVGLPVLLVLNKKDLIKPGEIAKKLEWYQKFTNVDDIIPISAKFGNGVDDIKEWILSKLPLGPAYYPRILASEHPERFFVGEIVREKIFVQYRQEIPYSCQVNVVSYKSRPSAKDFIQVEILVEKESQRSIILGKDGKAIKMLATASRLDIEDFLQKKVYLEIEVKVKENWRQHERLLKRYG
ncbi:GTPase ERA1, chloroplastic-like [Miscanthus floridulus]|uniref:GTPase ERA1, chloroplastic-like n=1 Tax=Miscanthus floridulus TaxID=154761 RepID=UPI00345850FB